MNLKERYSKEDNIVLINIIENPGAYTKECVSVVEEILVSRDLDEHYLTATAESLLREKIKVILDKFDPYNDKLKIPESQYIDDEHIMEILKEEFNLWMETKEALKFDVWKYAIGGIIS